MRRERPGPLHEQVQVVLERVADGAVALERLAGGERGGVAGQGLGHRHMGRRVGIVVRDRPRGAVHERAGELDRDAGVGEVVLHGLEAADGHAELLALLGVVDGEVEHPAGEARRAARPRRARRGRTPRRARFVADRRGRLPLDPREPARSVDAGGRREHRVGASDQEQGVVVVDDDRVGRLRVRRVRIAPERGGDRDVAGRGLATRGSSVGSTGHRDERVLHERFRKRGVARLLDDEHEVERA